MIAGLAVISLIAAILVCSVVIAGPLFPIPKHLVAAPFPEVYGLWSSYPLGENNQVMMFPESMNELFRPFAMTVYVFVQEGPLFWGSADFVDDDCESPFGCRYVTGHVTRSGQVHMTISDVCIVSQANDNLNCSITHLFTGQLSGDKQRIAGVLQSLVDGSISDITLKR